MCAAWEKLFHTSTNRDVLLYIFVVKFFDLGAQVLLEKKVLSVNPVFQFYFRVPLKSNLVPPI